ncbi:MAG TPA: argininosuccinate lyase, partial [Sedimentisphaerales bacterium]|nr:argininosuccinate lyase [Sedimentisphaerales bacterium]
YDRRLYKYDVVGSLAHAQMLCDQKLLTREELKKIKDGLLGISEDIANGAFVFDPVFEDIHMAIEAALIQKIGEAGKKLHTGRSRNDQVSTDLRLWMRDEIELMQARITLLQKAFVKAAEKYVNHIMPAYTHLQRAQPVSVAMYLLSFAEMLERDFIRLGNCRSLLNVSPLGCGAVGGSTLPLDRANTQKQLGFAGICENCIDAVSDRDFCAEFVFDCSLVAAHLSRFAEDWIIFCSTEFGFIRIDDKYCTSSSMMPQKRNPDLLELIRGKTGSVYGALVGILTILKAQPLSYNRDLQEDKIHVFSAADTVQASLAMARSIVEHTHFQTQHISSLLDNGFLDATSLAEYLVVKGVPFRQAHGIVGKLVAECEKTGKKLGDLSMEELQAATTAFEKDVYEHLGASNVVKKYATEGAGGTEQAAKQTAEWNERLSRR